MRVNGNDDTSVEASTSNGINVAVIDGQSTSTTALIPADALSRMVVPPPCSFGDGECCSERHGFADIAGWFNAPLTLGYIDKKRFQTSRFKKCGLNLRSLWQGAFHSVGKLIQRQWVASLVVSLVLLLCMAYGVVIQKPTWTVDPIELWIKPSQRLLHAMNYYEAVANHNFDSWWKSGATISGKNGEAFSFESPKPTPPSDWLEKPLVFNSKLFDGGILSIAQKSANGSSILNDVAFRAHLQLMQIVTKTTLLMDGTQWSLTDFCHRPPGPFDPNLDEFQSIFVDHFVPCTIVTPVDCFWDGAKLLGPTPPLELVGYWKEQIHTELLSDSSHRECSPITNKPVFRTYQQLMIPALACYDMAQLTWANLRIPKLVLHDVENAGLHKYEFLRDFVDRAGIRAYTDRMCLDPFEEGCPYQLPEIYRNNKATNNRFRYCDLLQNPLFLAKNKTSPNPVILKEELPVDKVRQSAQHDNKLRRTRRSSEVGYDDYESIDTEYDITAYDEMKNNKTIEIDDSDQDPDSDGGPPTFPLPQRHRYCSHETLTCRSKRTDLIRWVRENRHRWDDMIPKDLQPRGADIAAEVNRCHGYAENILSWPAELLLGGVRYADSHRDAPLSATSLHTRIPLLDKHALYFRKKNGLKSDYSRAVWSVERASDVLTAWLTKVEAAVSAANRQNTDNSGAAYNWTSSTSRKIDTVLVDWNLDDAISVTAWVALSLLPFVVVITVTGKIVSRCSCSFIFLCTLLTFVGWSLIQLSYISTVGVCGYLGMKANYFAASLAPSIVLGFGCADLLPFLFAYKHDVQVALLLKQKSLAMFVAAVILLIPYVTVSLEFPVPALTTLATHLSVGQVLSVLVSMVALSAVMVLGQKTVAHFCRSRRAVDWRQNQLDQNRIRHDTNRVTDQPQPSYTSFEDSQPIIRTTMPHLNRHFVSTLVETYFAPLLSTGIAQCIVGAVALPILFYGIYCAQFAIAVNFPRSCILPLNSSLRTHLTSIENEYGTYEMRFVLTQTIEYAEKQNIIMELHRAIEQNEFSVKDATTGRLSTPFWLDKMTEWLANLQFEYNQNYHNFHSGNASSRAIFAKMLLCNTAPGNGKCANLSSSTRLIQDDGAVNPNAFYKYLTAWHALDPAMYYLTEVSFYPPPGETSNVIDSGWSYDPLLKEDQNVIAAVPPVYSQIPFYITGLTDAKSILDCIKQLLAISERFKQEFGLPNYIEGPPLTFWENYLQFDHVVIKSFLIVLSSLWLLIAVVYVAPWTATLLVGCALVSVGHCVALLCALQLDWNYVSAFCLLIALAHSTGVGLNLATCFHSALRSSKSDRMCIALSECFSLAVCQTVCRCLPLIVIGWLADFPIVSDFARFLCFCLLIGMLNQMLLLPALLSKIGPSCEVFTIRASQEPLSTLEFSENRRPSTESSDRCSLTSTYCDTADSTSDARPVRYLSRIIEMENEIEDEELIGERIDLRIRMSLPRGVDRSSLRYDSDNRSREMQTNPSVSTISGGARYASTADEIQQLDDEDEFVLEPRTHQIQGSTRMS